MVAVLVVVGLVVAALCAGWSLMGVLARPGDDPRVRAEEHPVPPASGRPPCACVAPRLTEDDLIAFGLQIESSDDVVSELVGRRG